MDSNNLEEEKKPYIGVLDDKKRRSYEAEFCSKMQKYLLHNHWGETFAWEAKVGYDNKPINLKSAFPPDKITGGLNHELTNLYNAKYGFLTYKISDYDRLEKPFDGVCFAACGHAYVFMTWMDDPDKMVYVIDVDKIISEIEKDRASISKVRAAQLADRIDTFVKDQRLIQSLSATS